MLLAAQLPPSHGGLSKSAIYISTEAPLATTRLTQLLQQHPRLSSLPPSSRPSLSRILGIQTPDLEYQEHVLRYQLPVAIQRHSVGLVVVDSVAANFRAEFARPENDARASGAAMAQRSAQLVQLGALLRSIARAHNVAVVVANQVADRFAAPPSTSTTTSRAASHNNSQGSNTTSATAARAPTPSQAAVPFISPDALTLDHQQRWFTGWGDARTSAESNSLKTPALGLVWTNQIAARVALVKQPVYSSSLAWISSAADGRENWRGEDGGGGESEIKLWRRWMRVVFTPWAAASAGRGVEFRILGRGVVAKETLEGEKEGEVEGKLDESMRGRKLDVLDTEEPQVYPRQEAGLGGGGGI